MRTALGCLLSLGLCLAPLLAGGCRRLLRAALVPGAPFDQTAAPPAPDYTDAASWAALPDREDAADVAPAGETDAQRTAGVDVFFVHPTTYFDDARWNQPLDDAKTNARTDRATMRGQASAFNAAGRIFAPRYRQATLGAYLAPEWDDTRAALDLAYDDVRRAFAYYLANFDTGRPLILASHSQGSAHLVRLLHDFFSGPENASLRARLVAAYAIGAAIPASALTETFPETPLCESPAAIGCLLTYNAVKAGKTPRQDFERRLWFPGGWRKLGEVPGLCVNPVTWRADLARSARGDHQGGVRFSDDALAPEPDVAWLTAACREDGFLDVDLIASRRYGVSTAGASYHVIDYALFYMDLRRNAQARARAFTP